MYLTSRRAGLSASAELLVIIMTPALCVCATNQHAEVFGEHQADDAAHRGRGATGRSRRGVAER